MVQVAHSHLFNDARQLWLQQLAEGPITIVQPYTGYKVHGVRFHTRTRSAKTKTYSCGVLVKGTGDGDNSGVEYHGVLEEVLRVEYLGEPIKRCVLFRCDWFDPSNPRGTRYSRVNRTYEVNHTRRYAKYDPFIIADVAYQVFYLPYPVGVPHKGNWWAAMLNKSRTCPQPPNDGEVVASIFQESVMSATHNISEALVEHLGDSSHRGDEVNDVGDIDSEEEEPPEVDEEEEQEWDDLETDTEKEDVHIPYHSSEDDSDSDEHDTGSSDE